MIDIYSGIVPPCLPASLPPCLPASLCNRRVLSIADQLVHTLRGPLNVSPTLSLGDGV